MKIKTLSIDIETFSSIDIGDCGVHRYADAPDFTILLFAYSVNYGEVKCVDFTSGEELPEEIYNAIWDESVTKTAFNAAFERTCIGKYYNRYCDPKQWSCTMVLSAVCGLPMSLKNVGAALGLPEDKAKMKVGADLIRYFCIPCKPTKTNGMRTRNMPGDAPDKWATFIEYNIRDVEVENTIRQKLTPYLPDFSEHRLWCLDQQINDRGIKVDIELAKNAITICDSYKERLLDRAKEISGLDNPNSNDQVKQWLEDQEGVEVLSLNKKAVADVVAQLQSDSAKEFMQLREQFSKSSIKKYEAVLRCACHDDHARGCFQFYGAATGRWSGRLIQLQNLPQNHLEDLDSARALLRDKDFETFECLYPNVQSVVSELIRTVLVPETGHKFIVADFSAIEARVIAFISGEQWRLDTFANGGDIYCASASQMFGVPVEKHGVNAHLRQKGKIAELALGYGGGVGALKAFGADKLGMSDEDMAQTVDMWRGASRHIVALWHSMEDSAIKCVVQKRPTVTTVGSIGFSLIDGTLWMELPSGRSIAYQGAEIGQDRWGRKSLTYLSQNQTTKKWERTETFGGKLVENCVQATARDCLKEAMLRLNDNGFDIRAHIHDEVVITEPIDGRSVEDVVKLMCVNSSWNVGLPLNADGYECSSYRKD